MTIPYDQYIATMEHEAEQIEKREGPSRLLLLVKCLIEFLKLQLHEQEQRRAA